MARITFFKVIISKEINCVASLANGKRRGPAWVDNDIVRKIQFTIFTNKDIITYKLTL